MASLSLDTLKFSKVLQDKAKLSSEQAEGFVEAIYGLLQNDLATKPDLQALELGLNAKLRELEQRLGAQMRELEQRLGAQMRELEQKLDAQMRELEQRLDAQMRELEQKLDAKIRQTELNLENKIEASKVEILKYLFGTIGLQTLVILGAVLALLRFGH